MTPPTTLIFDLSEVLIAGLLGVEHELALRCQTTPADALAHLGGEHLQQLCRGELTEDRYLDLVCRQTAWTLPPAELKSIIRSNFARKVPGTEELLRELASRHELVLLSDHGREWVEHILTLHPFLVTQFAPRHFSFELGAIKADPIAFTLLLARLGRSPEECLFIDDSPRNVAVAESLGIASIRFTSSSDLAAELRRRGLLPA